ncbi:MAG: hypothetical protein ACK2UO_10810 [Caldilineaceae bacterium]|jgi:hypothetical protein
MSDEFVNAAKERRGAIEALIAGLPGINGYVDKELRRDADKRVRNTIASRLEEQKQALFEIQRKLTKGGGLKYVDDVDSAVQKLQLLADRIKTASYGYAGFFDPVRVKEEELDALHRFDVALAARTVEVEADVQALGAAVDGDGDVVAASNDLIKLINELNSLFQRRSEAILSPDLLLDAQYVPDVDPSLLAK